MLEMFRFKGVVTDGAVGIQGAEVIVENRQSGRRIKPIKSVTGGRYNVDLGELLTSDDELLRVSVKMPVHRIRGRVHLEGRLRVRSVLVPENPQRP